MKKMRLSALLEQIITIPKAADVEVTGLALDSRLVKAGDLFFACSGSHLDGRQFIQDAINKGAKAVVAQNAVEPCAIPTFTLPDLTKKLGTIAARFFDFPSKKLQMIGVTGTNGKTSCSHFIAAALETVATPCAVIGTLGNGLYGHTQPASLTTPDAITIQKYLAEYLAEGAKAVSMEVSSHSLDQERVGAIKFDVGIFTNLTRDHLDYHGSMEAYGQAKEKLFKRTKCRYAVINADDEFGRKLIEAKKHPSIFAYSLNKKMTLPASTPLITVDHVQQDTHGLQARVYSPWGEGNIQVPLIGQFNLSNVLAVLSTLCLLRIPFPIALNCLRTLKSVPGRMQMMGGENKPLIVVDYAHTPDALEKVLQSLRHHCTGKLYCLFGCGGDRDRGKRPLMAKIAEQYADVIMVTDDNPRTEDSKSIISDIMRGFDKPEKIKIQSDRSQAIQEIIDYAAKEDCVLIAGKGAETYQQIGTEKIPFSDIETVEKLINRRR